MSLRRQTTHARNASQCLLFCIAAMLLSSLSFAGQLTVQIDGIDDSLKPAVAAAAEIMQYDKREVSAAQARRLYDRAPEQIAKSLEAYGYYNATADGELKEAPPGFVAVLHVHPGEPTTVATFKIDVPDPARDE